MTMLVDIAVERYKFVCGRCDYTWTADYDVQYVTDDVGATFAFYRLDGVPVPPPTGGEVICPHCGAANVTVIPQGRRDSPPAHLDSDEPRERVTTGLDERWGSVPHLSAVVSTEQDQAGDRRNGS